MKKKTSSIRDVAGLSGVSIATVSNVLNNRCAVSDALRQRVLQAAAELNYTANPIARSMRSHRTMNIGIIVLDFNCIFFAPLLKGVQNVMSKNGYSVITYDSNYDSELEHRYVRTMRNNLVDGIILAGNHNAADRAYYTALFRDDGSDVPVVCLESDMTDIGIDSILIDNFLAAQTATSHLIETGSRRILHIRAPQVADNSVKRLAGYRSALEMAGIEPDPSLEFFGDFTAISGYNVIQHAIGLGLQFDGVFAANDQMAVGAIRALQNAKLRIPEDVRVVGFDNTFIASIVDPALTTIEVPNYQMGVRAAQQLLARIQNPEKQPVAIHLDYELIIRRSTMLSAQTNWNMEYW